MKKLPHKDFRLALKKWNWRLKNYDYSLTIEENNQQMIKDIPELKKYRAAAYCTFCAKYADRDNLCPGCPFPKEGNCLNSESSIYCRWGNKTMKNENATAEIGEMVQLQDVVVVILPAVPFEIKVEPPSQS